jgi:thiol-disulfide isomerase/thioredoxin
MSVNRLTIPSLQKLMGGKIKEKATCIIKFYSNGCHYCHNLREYYEEMSNEKEYSDMHFFAFNIDDYPQIQKQINLNGVPSIYLLKTGEDKIKLRCLQEPEDPNSKTWYRVKDIKEFINKEK